MNDDNSLLINIEAIDEASETIQGVSEQAQTMADSISGSVLQANEALTGMDESVTMVGDAFAGTATTIEGSMGAAAESVTTLNELMAMDSEAISEEALQMGVSFDESAAMIQAGAVEAETAMGEEGMAGSATSLKSSMMQIGVVASIVFLTLKKEVTNAIDDAEKWNKSIAIINQELQNTGSSIPISQITAYAQEIQKSTLFTQQSALDSEKQILAHKDLQASYKELTMLTADLATKMGGGPDSMANAATLLTNALEDPAMGLSRLAKAANVDFSPAMVTLINKLAKGGDSAKAAALIHDTLTKSIEGVAVAAANAPGGGITQFGNDLSSLNTQIGRDLVPALESILKALRPVLETITQWTTDHPKLTAAILLGALALAALLAIVVAVGIAISAITVAITAFIGLFAEGAIAGVIMVVVAVVTALIIYLVSQWNGFVSDTKIVWNGLKSFFSTLWNDIKIIFNDAITWINNMIDAVLSRINSVISGARSIGGGIVGAVGGAVSSVANFVGTHLASGGLVTSPTIALVGEAGPEAVIPLSMLGSGSPLGGNGGGSGITVYITGTVQSTADQAKQLGDAIARQINRSLKLQSFK